MKGEGKNKMKSPIFKLKDGVDLVIENAFNTDLQLTYINRKKLKQYLVDPSGEWEMPLEAFEAFFTTVLV